MMSRLMVCFIPTMPWQAFGSGVPRRKRDRSSRLGRKAGDKPKVDRFHYLFEAIEADKASDSETANGTGSRGSQATEQDDAQVTSKQLQSSGDPASHQQDEAQNTGQLLNSSATGQCRQSNLETAVCLSH